MRVVRSAADRIEVRGRSPGGASILVGVALALVAALPLGASGPVGATHWMVTSLCAASAVGLIVAGWPRARAVVLAPTEGWAIHRGRKIDLSGARLEMACELDKASDWPPPHYRVSLESKTASSLLLLDGLDPAAVLSDLRVVASRTGLPVTSDCGLPPGAGPWPARSSGPGGPKALNLSPIQSQGAIALTVLVGAGILAALMARQVSSAMERGVEVAALSTVLPALFVAIVLAIGLVVATAQIRLTTNGTVRRESRALGVPWRVEEMPISSVSGAYFVGPRDTRPRHLVVDGAERVISVPCDADRAGDLKELADRWLEASRPSGGGPAPHTSDRT